MISVILPVLNEESALPATLTSLFEGAGKEPFDVWVVDGGSQDSSPRIASSFPGVHVLFSTPGRSHQMNLGASRSMGESLLFLHADTLLPPGWNDEAMRHLEEPDVALGAFRFHLSGNGLWKRGWERGVYLRCHLLGLPYGDQGLFLRRETFIELGGFAPLRIMEDLDLLLRARKRGRIALSSLPATTSDRRWRRLGVLPTTVQHLLWGVSFWFGIRKPFLLNPPARNGA